jgi:hypothetical protein
MIKIWNILIIRIRRISDGGVFHDVEIGEDPFPGATDPSARLKESVKSGWGKRVDCLPSWKSSTDDPQTPAKGFAGLRGGTGDEARRVDLWRFAQRSQEPEEALPCRNLSQSVESAMFLLTGSSIDEYSPEVKTAIRAALDASLLCQQVQKDLTGESSFAKSDRSPVTVADYGAQAIICKLLRKTASLQRKIPSS